MAIQRVGHVVLKMRDLEYDWREEGMRGTAHPFDIEAVPAGAEAVVAST